MEIYASDLVHFIVFVGVLFVYYQYKSLPGDLAKSPLLRSFWKEVPTSKASILLAAESAKQKDFLFLESCLRHPDDEIALFTSQILSKMDHPTALKILMNQIEELDKELSHSTSDQSQLLLRTIGNANPDLNITNLAKFLDEHLHPKLLEFKPQLLEDHLNRESWTPDQKEISELLWQIALNKTGQEMERYYAIKSLCTLDLSPSHHRMQALLEDPSRWVILGGLELCGIFPRKEFAFLLENILRSKDDALIIEAIYGLSCIGLSTSISRIRFLITHSNRLVSEAAKYAVEKLNQNRS